MRKKIALLVLLGMSLLCASAWGFGKVVMSIGGATLDPQFAMSMTPVDCSNFGTIGYYGTVAAGDSIRYYIDTSYDGLTFTCRDSVNIYGPVADTLIVGQLIHSAIAGTDTTSHFDGLLIPWVDFRIMNIATVDTVTATGAWYLLGDR